MNSDDSNTVTPTDQTPSPPPEAPTVSQHFNSLSADVTLISQDGMLFKTHLRNLAACSEVFEGMLEVGNDETKVELRVEESAATLSLLLPYAYPASLDVLNLDDPEIGHFLVAVDKYSVGRAKDAIREAFAASLSRQSPNDCDYIKMHLLAFLWAERSYGRWFREAALRQLVVLHPRSVANAFAAASGVLGPFRDSYEKLQTFLDRRYAAWENEVPFFNAGFRERDSPKYRAVCAVSGKGPFTKKWKTVGMYQHSNKTKAQLVELFEVDDCQHCLSRFRTFLQDYPVFPSTF